MIFCTCWLYNHACLAVHRLLGKSPRSMIVNYLSLFVCVCFFIECVSMLVCVHVHMSSVILFITLHQYCTYRLNFYEYGIKQLIFLAFTHKITIYRTKSVL